MSAQLQEGETEPGASPRYYGEGPDAVVMRPLDGLTLLFHRPSGVTHIIASPLPEILAALDDHPQTAQMLLDRLSRVYDLEGDAAELERHLESLAALGLARVGA